ncbi:mitochondrial 37S ribosomal protein uS8m [Limtongia smithiae]|uniref:mitochondrial 37S ribosomal protein uS8m n=1 Tax=Limtongia smithiae TaxID=1125753 RepID=UPI0034CE78F7
MSLQNLSYVCSHLQNCGRAKTPLTSVQYTKLHLGILLGLYRHGLISAVTIGDNKGPDLLPTEITPANVATRRLWVTLKYKDYVPVMSHAQTVSNPRKQFSLRKEELSYLLRGQTIRNVKPILPGELMFIRTDKGILESREALEIGRGGMALARFR